MRGKLLCWLIPHGHGPSPGLDKRPGGCLTGGSAFAGRMEGDMGWRTWTRRVILPAGLGCVLAASMAAPAFAGHGPGTWRSLAPVPAPTEGMSVAHAGNVMLDLYGFGPDSGA